MKNIEDILVLNNYISEGNLIFNKFKTKVKFLFIISFIPLIVLFIYFVIGLFPKPEFKSMWPVIPMLILMICLSILYHYHAEKIIEKYYPYITKKKRKRRGKAILEIRKEELKKIIGNKHFFEKENLIFIIESLKFHSQKGYNYHLLWNAIIILSGVFLGTVISILTEEFRNEIGTEKFVKNLAISLGLLVFCVLFIDHYFVKDFLHLKGKNKKRLIRTFENIYFEKYAT